MARKISQSGINLVCKFEGCILHTYKDAVGVLTIGYGHTGSDVKPGMTITQKQAEDLLRKDLARFEGYVNSPLYVPVTAKLNQNQFDALVSFSFNVGQGNLKTLCKDRNLAQIADAIPKYCKAGGKTLTGLVRRRAAEQALFNKSVDGSDDTKTEFTTETKVTVSTNCLLFQKAVNADKLGSLTEDGKLGEKTKAVINKIILKAGYDKATNRYTVGSKGEVVRFVQARLGIAEDGLFGAGTRNSVLAWQSNHKLEKDGIVGPATLMTMV